MTNNNKIFFSGTEILDTCCLKLSNYWLLLRHYVMTSDEIFHMKLKSTLMSADYTQYSKRVWAVTANEKKGFRFTASSTAHSLFGLKSFKKHCLCKTGAFKRHVSRLVYELLPELGSNKKLKVSISKIYFRLFKTIENFVRSKANSPQHSSYSWFSDQWVGTNKIA